MRRWILLVVVSGLSLGLLAGCRRTERTERQAPQKARKAQRTNTVAAVKVKRPVRTRSAPAVAPGSIKYLDCKNGFRDVVFGQQESNLTSLVLVRQDVLRQVKTFTRAGEELSLGSVPLDSVEYNSFQGQLYQVLIKWRMEQKNPALETAPAVTLAPFCASLYGPPQRHLVRKTGTELKWRGRRVELTLTETVIPGVPDKLNGGWAITPAVTGIMIVENIELRKALATMVASGKEFRKDGL